MWRLVLRSSSTRSCKHVPSIHLDVSDEVLEERRKIWETTNLGYGRGYAQLYIDHVQQAHLGADFDFLRGGSGDQVPRDSH